MKICDRIKLPTYGAQVRTWSKALELGVACARFRAAPAFRDAQANLARSKVARIVRTERKQIRQERASKAVDQVGA